MEFSVIIFLCVVIVVVGETSSFVAAQNETTAMNVTNVTNVTSTVTTTAASASSTTSLSTIAAMTSAAASASAATGPPPSNVSLVSSTTVSPALGNVTTAVTVPTNQTDDGDFDLLFQDLETNSVTENFLDYALEQDYEIESNPEAMESETGHVLVEDHDKLLAFKALIEKDKVGKPLSKKDKEKAGKNRGSDSGPENMTAMFNPDLFEGDIIGAKVELRKDSKNRNAAANKFQRVSLSVSLKQS